MNTSIAGKNGNLSSAQPLSSLQIRTFVLGAMVIFLDGVDSGLISIAIPGFAARLHVQASALGWAVSASFLGAALGAVLFGSLADRIGSKRALIMAVLDFCLFTLVTPLADSLGALVAYRLLAGLGLGGAAPCVIALTAEYAPTRIRGSIVSMVWASFPLGLLIGGLLSGAMLTRYSWEVVFYICGALPFALIFGIWGFLPESIDFLLRKSGGEARARALIDAIGYDVRDGEPAATSVRPSDSHEGVGTLLRDGRLTTTLCLWMILFACMGTTAALVWVPAILHQHGVSLAAAAVTNSFLGVGTLLGMLVAGWLVDRFGALRALFGPLLVGVVATGALGQWITSPVHASAFVAAVAACLGLGASGAIALAALKYPRGIRSIATGWSMGMGRVGQVVMPGAFAALMAAQWSSELIFLLLAACPLAAVAATVLLGRSENE